MNINIKKLYDKLLIKYSSLPYDDFNRKVFRNVQRSLNLLYPYEFIHDSKGVPNYNLKSIVLDLYGSDLNIVRKYKRAVYLQDKIAAQKQRYIWFKNNSEQCYQSFDNESGDVVNLWTFVDEEFVNTWIPIGDDLKYNQRFLFLECERIVNAETQRRKRLRQRISSILESGDAYFVTLTFSDLTLNNTSAVTRRRYVTRLLNSVSDNYVGNVDFGKLRGREHYHAVIHSDKLKDIKFTYDKRYGFLCKDCSQFNEWSQLGYYSIKSCGDSDVDKKRLASYTAKLVNHAIKETTKRNALIYSR